MDGVSVRAEENILTSTPSLPRIKLMVRVKPPNVEDITDEKPLNPTVSLVSFGSFFHGNLPRLIAIVLFIQPLESKSHLRSLVPIYRMGMLVFVIDKVSLLQGAEMLKTGDQFFDISTFRGIPH